MKDRLKKLLYLYERAFWYIAQAKNEALKPLGFWNETILLLTFLSVRFKLNPAFTDILLAYLIILVIAAIIGKLIVLMGIVKYNTRIANYQNPELMEIHKEIMEIKKMIQNK